MTDHITCPGDDHDMRPMPSMRAHVCRRCGFYVPIEEDDAPQPRAVLNLVLALALVIVAAVAVALIRNP